MRREVFSFTDDGLPGMRPVDQAIDIERTPLLVAVSQDMSPRIVARLLRGLAGAYSLRWRRDRGQLTTTGS